MGFILQDTYLCYKKITREYRLIRYFKLITHYEVSQRVLLYVYSNRYIRKQQKHIL